MNRFKNPASILTSVEKTTSSRGHVTNTYDYFGNLLKIVLLLQSCCPFHGNLLQRLKQTGYLLNIFLIIFIPCRFTCFFMQQEGFPPTDYNYIKKKQPRKCLQKELKKQRKKERKLRQLHNCFYPFWHHIFSSCLCSENNKSKFFPEILKTPFWRWWNSFENEIIPLHPNAPAK